LEHGENKEGENQFNFKTKITTKKGIDITNFFLVLSDKEGNIFKKKEINQFSNNFFDVPLEKVNTYIVSLYNDKGEKVCSSNELEIKEDELNAGKKSLLEYKAKNPVRVEVNEEEMIERTTIKIFVEFESDLDYSEENSYIGLFLKDKDDDLKEYIDFKYVYLRGRFNVIDFYLPSHFNEKQEYLFIFFSGESNKRVLSNCFKLKSKILLIK
jgi:hypothetical protein